MGSDTSEDRVARAPVAGADAALAEHSRARSRRRVVVAIVLGIFALFFGAWLWLFFSDAAPPDDPALRLERWPEVPNEENGAWLYREAMLAVDFPAFVSFQGLDASRAFAESLDLYGEPGSELIAALREPLRVAVEAQRPALDLLSRAARARECSPEWDLALGQLANVADGTAFVVRLAVLEKWFESDPEGAWELLHEQRILLRKMSEHPRSSMDLHTSLAHQRLLGPFRILLAVSPERTPEQLRRWLANLASPLLVEDWRARQLRRDAGLVDGWARAGFGTSSLWYRPGRTRARLADLHREWLAAADQWFEPLPPSRQHPGYLSPRESFLGIVGGNLVGERFVKYWRVSQEVHVALPLEARGALLMDELARAAIALRLHHHARGEWPESLDALVPELLPAVPRDPHDPAGGPLHWSNEDLALWSVGRDRAVIGPASATLSRFDQILAPTPTVRLGEPAGAEPRAEEKR